MFDSHKYLAIFNPQALDQFRHMSALIRLFLQTELALKYGATR